jgi:NAD(P)-dependent dehydrogenase (short-subunit alcohol dehydrogenase family)
MGKINTKYTLCLKKTLDNKNLVIISGTTGLGLSAAKAFIQSGANVIVVGRNKGNAAEAKRLHGIKAEVLSLIRIMMIL